MKYIILIITTIFFFTCHAQVTKMEFEKKTKPESSNTSEINQLHKDSILLAFKNISTKQYTTSNYDEWLSKINDKDSLLWFKSEIETIKKLNTQMDNVQSKFFMSEKWNLIYFNYSGWEGNIHDLPKGFNDCYVTNNQTVIYTSSEIFTEFNIDDSLSLELFPLNYFPIVSERSDLFNARWTAIQPSPNYLLIRMVHSYPDGSYSSWNRERIYYFRKLNK